MKVEILRTYLPTETLGSFMVDDVCQAKTMELPWKNNAHDISCIPEGTYIVKREATSNHHKYPHFRLYGIPSPDFPNDPKKFREGILIHKITFVKDLLGCIGVGSAFADLNRDRVPDITGSTVALDHLYNMMPDSFKLTIKRNPKTA